MSHHHCHGEHGDECCAHEHHHHHHDSCCSQESECETDFAQELLELADTAWMELLKDKIKEQIESASGKHLDELAKLVASSNKTRWEHKMDSKKVQNEYKEKLCEYFQRK